MYTGVDKPGLIRMFEVTEPSIVFCDNKAYDLVADCLMHLKNKAKVFTFNGTNGNSEPAEVLFEETGIEEEFVYVSNIEFKYQQKFNFFAFVDLLILMESIILLL